MFKHRIGLVSAAAIALAAVTLPAHAAPTNSNTFDLQLHCDDGNTYPVSVVDNQGQSPAHVLTGTSVFVPTYFGAFDITVTAGAGEVVDTISVPPEVVHGRSGERLTTLHCTFEQTDTESIPGIGEVSIHSAGSVDGFLSH